MKSLINKARQFVRVEDGLVTVEWVALTAGMVVAAVAIGFIVMSNTYDEASSVGGGILSTTSSVYGTGGSNLGTP
jgi:hypothetical protein